MSVYRLREGILLLSVIIQFFQSESLKQNQYLAEWQGISPIMEGQTFEHVTGSLDTVTSISQLMTLAVGEVLPLHIQAVDSFFRIDSEFSLTWVHWRSSE